MALSSNQIEAVAAPVVVPAVRRRAWWRAVRQPSILLGLIVFAIFVLLALLAPVISPYDPLGQNVIAGLRPPSASYLFGTDKLGRDVFSRVIHGTRLALLSGTAVVLLAGVFGTLVGLIAGYLGSWVDQIMMRVTDIFFAFPALILSMAIAGALGRSLPNALIAISVVTWPVYARLIRGQVLSLKQRDFVLAAHTLGVPEWQIALRHLLPNTLTPLLVQASFDFGGAILSVAGLSFIGFGAQPPVPEWGVMISEGRNYIATQWWLATMPALAMLVVVVGCNLLGDGLRDLLDPRLRDR